MKAGEAVELLGREERGTRAGFTVFSEERTPLEGDEEEATCLETGREGEVRRRGVNTVLGVKSALVGRTRPGKGGDF